MGVDPARRFTGSQDRFDLRVAFEAPRHRSHFAGELLCCPMLAGQGQAVAMALEPLPVIPTNGRLERRLAEIGR